MKKVKVLGLLAVMMLAFCSGCGKEEAKEPEKETTEKEETDVSRSSSSRDTEPEVGGDWRTWNAFHIVEWETPDYYEDLYLTVYDPEAGITVVHDYDEYTEMCILDIGGVADEDTIWDSMLVYDMDDDGYDDLFFEDIYDGVEYYYAFLYDPSIDEFVYDEAYSAAEASTLNPGSDLTAYEEAYIPVIQEAEQENDSACYYLFNINEDTDDIYELIVEYGEDRELQVYTIGAQTEYGFYAVYIGSLASSADYAYVTMDAYDGDAFDGMLTLNVCVQGVRWLYAYSVDDSFDLVEQEVYEVEEDDYNIDGEMLDRYSVSDWSPLASIDIEY